MAYNVASWIKFCVLERWSKLLSILYICLYTCRYRLGGFHYCLCGLVRFWFYQGIFYEYLVWKLISKLGSTKLLLSRVKVWFNTKYCLFDVGPHTAFNYEKSLCIFYVVSLKRLQHDNKRENELPDLSCLC